MKDPRRDKFKWRSRKSVHGRKPKAGKRLGKRPKGG